MKAAPKTADQTELAKGFTVRDYKEAKASRNRLRIAKGICARFTERYIAPVKGPERNGFAMMAIACLMIEALAALQLGLVDTKGKSGKMFRHFFASADLFKDFRGREDDFYGSVRCGILHQAETCNGWKVLRKGPLFDPTTKTINAALFIKKLEQFLNTFCDDLEATAWDDQQWLNARKKIDAICDNC
jgi:hypothetical protein